MAWKTLTSFATRLVSPCPPSGDCIWQQTIGFVKYACSLGSIKYAVLTVLVIPVATIVTLKTHGVTSLESASYDILQTL